MNAAVWKGPDAIRVESLPLPAVPEGWALVRVAFNGICGTDLSIHAGKHPRAEAGLIPGHELSGWVHTAGATGPREGALVVAEPLISCGNCRPCRSGASHVCERLGLYGIDAPGGLAEYVALPPEILHEVPGHIEARLAALAEPVAVAVHAVRLAEVQAGDTVAVYGAGPIGLLTALVARHEGAGQVIVSEPGEWRRGVAEAMGFTVVPAGRSMVDAVEELTEGRGADVTFDSAAHPSISAELAQATRVLGRIVIVGIYKAAAELDLQTVSFREQSLVGVRVYTTDDVRRAIELIAGDELGLERFPVSTFALEDVEAAFEAARTGTSALKVMVSPDSQEARA